MDEVIKISHALNKLYSHICLLVLSYVYVCVNIQEDYTALNCAVSDGDDKMCELLLTMGADINKASDVSNTK